MTKTPVSHDHFSARSRCSSWTRRDHELVEAHVHKFRVSTRDQILRHWWKPDSDRGKERLALLCESDLLERYRVNAHPLPLQDKPLFAWNPGDESPDCEVVSHACRSRWTGPTKPTTVYIASRKAVNLFGRPGGYKGLPRVFEITHDLLLSEVYLLYRLRFPNLAKRWVGEDCLGKAGYGIKALTHLSLKTTRQ